LGQDVAALDPVASFLSHLMILPLSIASESLGMTTFVTAMAQLAFTLHTRRIAATILSFEGVLSFSRLRAYGIGALAPVTRSTGASRSSKACPVTNAPISEPMPAKPAPAAT